MFSRAGQQARRAQEDSSLICEEVSLYFGMQGASCALGYIDAEQDQPVHATGTAYSP
jgi:hypothetical protein